MAGRGFAFDDGAGSAAPPPLPPGAPPAAGPAAAAPGILARPPPPGYGQYPPPAYPGAAQPQQQQQQQPPGGVGSWAAGPVGIASAAAAAAPPSAMMAQRAQPAAAQRLPGQVTQVATRLPGQRSAAAQHHAGATKVRQTSVATKPGARAIAPQKKPEEPSRYVHPQIPDDKNILKKKQKLVARFKFQSALPALPFDCKLLAPPVDLESVAAYQPTTLELYNKPQLHFTRDTVVPLDFVNPVPYTRPKPVALDDRDKTILEPEPVSANNSGAEPIIYPWMLKTVYLERLLPKSFSNEIDDSGNRKAAVAKHRELLNMPPAARAAKRKKDIIESFEIANQNVGKRKHASKPNLHLVEELAVLPDFERQAHAYRHFEFARTQFFDASSKGLSDADKRQRASEGIFVRDNASQPDCITYLLPEGDEKERGVSKTYRGLRDYKMIEVPGERDAYVFSIDTEGGVVAYNRLLSKFLLKQAIGDSLKPSVQLGETSLEDLDPLEIAAAQEEEDDDEDDEDQENDDEPQVKRHKGNDDADDEDEEDA